MPTQKRLKHLARQEKKKSNQRTEEERLEKTNEIKDSLRENHLTPEMIPQIQDFYDIIDKFVSDGIPDQGVIDIPEIQARLLYFFTNNKTKPIDAMIRPYKSESEQPEIQSGKKNNRKNKKLLLDEIKKQLLQSNPQEQSDEQAQSGEDSLPPSPDEQAQPQPDEDSLPPSPQEQPIPQEQTHTIESNQ